MDTRGTPFCALITGAAKRIGATIAQELHAQGMDILLHCHRSERLARELARQCNARRADSVFVLRADLNDLSSLDPLLEQAFSIRPRIDALIHNASLFHPTPLPDCSHEDWERILRVNLSAPFFLSQRFAAQEPRPAHIIHIADIHGQRPLAGHVPYSVSKAGLIMLTKALAQELAPATRVNAIAPGAISWPEGARDTAREEEILRQIPLGRTGEYADIAHAVRFLLQDASYVTGEVLAVDGGRSMGQ